MHTEPAAPTEVPPILDRPESSGFWAKGWPVLVLGFITLLLIRACVPSISPPPPAPFDAGKATQSANDRAISALDAITADTPLEATLKALNLPVINFASASAEIPPDAQPVLAKAATVMKTLPTTVRLEISGHTDNTGTTEGNLVLSRQRAQSVANFLVGAGVVREQIVTQGFGDSRPLSTNATEEGRFRNRRIEIRQLAR